MCVLTRLALVSCVLAVAVAPAAHGAAVIATHGPKNLTAVSPTSTSSTPLGVSSTESFSEPSSEPSSKPTPLARSRRHVPHDEDRDVLVGPQEYGVANYFRGFGGYHQHYSPQCRFYHSRTIDLSNDLLLLPYAARVIDVSRYLNARPRSLVLQVGPRRFAPYEHFTRKRRRRSRSSGRSDAPSRIDLVADQVLTRYADMIRIPAGETGGTFSSILIDIPANSSRVFAISDPRDWGEVLRAAARGGLRTQQVFVLLANDCDFEKLSKTDCKQLLLLLHPDKNDRSVRAACSVLFNKFHKWYRAQQLQD